MKNYVKERVADPDKDEYFQLHWISHVSSLKNPKDMSDEMTNMYENDLENSTQECEGAVS